MTEIDPQEESLRQMFKYFNPFMLLMWRLGLERWINFWPEGTGRIMVLVHTGRKSNKRYRTPVNYAIVNGDVYCTAGFGQVSDWYRNVIANPQVEVWLPEGWWVGVAEDISSDQKRIPLLREVIVASGFAGRMAGLDAVAMTDEEFDEATESYRLIRIRRTVARTGPGGPGDLAWLWPLTTLFLLMRLIFRKKRKK